MFFWRVYEFSFDVGWIYEKMDEISKPGQFRGPTLRRRGPTPKCGMSTLRCGREGGLDKPRVRRGVAKLCHGEGLRGNIAMLSRGIALFTDMCFYHVLL